MLTIKSDDVNGRSKAYESIVKGENLKRPGIPESFKVLVRELQSIGLDVSVAKRTREGGEIEVDLMTEVEEVRPRGMRRMSPFGEIGIESELAELRQQSVPQGVVAVSEGDDDFGEEGGGDSESDSGSETGTSSIMQSVVSALGGGDDAVATAATDDEAAVDEGADDDF